MRCLSVCLSVCLSRSYILSKRIKISSNFFHRWILSHSGFSVPNGMAIFRREPPPHLTGASYAGGVGRNRNSEPISDGLTACVNAATGQVLSTGSPVDHSHRLASCDTSLVVSGGVDCGRRRRNIYDKKPQRYAKDNRTAQLTARSDKSVAYVTNNTKISAVAERPSDASCH